MPASIPHSQAGLFVSLVFLFCLCFCLSIWVSYVFLLVGLCVFDLGSFSPNPDIPALGNVGSVDVITNRPLAQLCHHCRWAWEAVSLPS